MAGANRARLKATHIARPVREGCLMGPVREGAGALRPAGALPAAETPQAAGLVEPGLLTLGAEVAAGPELAQDTRSLHSGLKPLEKTFRVLSFPKRDECQYDLLSAPDGHI